jgi:hypothetical protein
MINGLLDSSLKRRWKRNGEAVEFVGELDSTHFDGKVTAAV